MVLNAAYLIERSRVESFHRVAAELAGQVRAGGLALDVSGPWPPYNFVAPPQR